MYEASWSHAFSSGAVLERIDVPAQHRDAVGQILRNIEAYEAARMRNDPGSCRFFLSPEEISRDIARFNAGPDGRPILADADLKSILPRITEAYGSAKILAGFGCGMGIGNSINCCAQYMSLQETTDAASRTQDPKINSAVESAAGQMRQEILSGNLIDQERLNRFGMIRALLEGDPGSGQPAFFDAIGKIRDKQTRQDALKFFQDALAQFGQGEGSTDAGLALLNASLLAGDAGVKGLVSLFEEGRIRPEAFSECLSILKAKNDALEEIKKSRDIGLAEKSRLRRDISAYYDLALAASMRGLRQESIEIISTAELYRKALGQKTKASDETKRWVHERLGDWRDLPGGSPLDALPELAAVFGRKPRGGKPRAGGDLAASVLSDPSPEEALDALDRTRSGRLEHEHEIDRAYIDKRRAALSKDKLSAGFRRAREQLHKEANAAAAAAARLRKQAGPSGKNAEEEAAQEVKAAMRAMRPGRGMMAVTSLAMYSLTPEAVAAASLKGETGPAAKGKGASGEAAGLEKRAKELERRREETDAGWTAEKAQQVCDKAAMFYDRARELEEEARALHAGKPQEAASKRSEAAKLRQAAEVALASVEAYAACIGQLYTDRQKSEADRLRSGIESFYSMSAEDAAKGKDEPALLGAIGTVRPEARKAEAGGSSECSEVQIPQGRPERSV